MIPLLRSARPTLDGDRDAPGRNVPSAHFDDRAASDDRAVSEGIPSGDNPAVRLPDRGDAKQRDGHSWHIFAPLLPLDRLKITRDQFIQAMAARSIGVGVHYQAIHLFTAYRALGYREGQFPNAEAIGRQTVTLPLFPAMEMSDVDRVVTAVNDIIAGARI
jgi:hypothetical protein